MKELPPLVGEWAKERATLRVAANRKPFQAVDGAWEDFIERIRRPMTIGNRLSEEAVKLLDRHTTQTGNRATC